MAVNLGDDADTTGAVYGQIAGAYYGYEEIPEGWRGKIVKRELIEGLAGNLLFQKHFQYDLWLGTDDSESMAG